MKQAATCENKGNKNIQQRETEYSLLSQPLLSVEEKEKAWTGKGKEKEKWKGEEKKGKGRGREGKDKGEEEGNEKE